MAELIAIHRADQHHAPMQPLDSARLVEDFGLEGDRGGRKGRKRQVLLMPNEVLATLDLQPGQVRENLTTQGLDLMALAAGARLRVGETLLEIVEPCAPCDRMDEVRPGLQATLVGQRGMIARIVEGGQVHTGDRVELLSEPPTA